MAGVVYNFPSWTVWISLAILCGFIGPCLGEYCTETYYYGGGSNTRVIHCSFGCCGSYYDQYCCVSNAGFIVGLVFAGIFVIAVISAAVCCFVKHKGTRGRVIQPSTASSSAVRGTTTTHNNVFIVPTNSNGPVGPPAYSTVPMPPPKYGTPYYGPPGGYMPGPGAPLPPAYSNQAMPPPPSYAAIGPAYPPPTPASVQPSPFAAAAASAPPS